jgi:hypothetical protein
MPTHKFPVASLLMGHPGADDQHLGGLLYPISGSIGVLRVIYPVLYESDWIEVREQTLNGKKETVGLFDQLKLINDSLSIGSNILFK